MGLGVNPDSLYAGLWGYSGALTAIAFGGLFIYMNRVRAFLYFIMASISTVIMHGATVAFLLQFGIPSLTLPFVLTSWIFMLPKKIVNAIDFIDVSNSEVITAESHLSRYKRRKEMHEKLKVFKNHKYLELIEFKELEFLEINLESIFLNSYAY